MSPLHCDNELGCRVIGKILLRSVVGARRTQLSLDQLPNLLAFELQAAQTIFQQDLYFGLADIPSYNLAELIDNWDAYSLASHSLLTLRLD